MISPSPVRGGPPPHSEGIVPMPTRPVPRAALVLARPCLAVAVAVSGGRIRPGATADGPDGRTHAPSCTCGGELDPCQPDEREPDRLVGVCTDCDAWIYRVPIGDGRVLALELPGPAAARAAAAVGPDDSSQGSGSRRSGPMMVGMYARPLAAAAPRRPDRPRVP
jgi:hypothetical protein